MYPDIEPIVGGNTTVKYKTDKDFYAMPESVPAEEVGGIPVAGYDYCEDAAERQAGNSNDDDE